VNDRYVAASTWFEPGPPSVRLVDRATGGVIAETRTCPWPFATAFVEGGTRLLVGGQRSACVLEVPSLRLLAGTGEIYPDAGPDDDLAFVRTLTAWPAARAFVAETDSGAVGVFSISDGRTLWKASDLLGGQRRVNVGPDGVLRVANLETRTMTSIEPTIQSTTHSLTTAEVASWDPSPPQPRTPLLDVCHIGSWILPRHECDG
jgi:hypothetical protein